MSVLVTGGAGFVGLNVVQALLSRGDDVVLFDAGELPKAARRALEPWSDFLFIERGSVLDAERVNAVFKDYPQIRRVIHGAAITSGPKREAADPSTIMDVNVRGVVNVIEAARRHAVERFVYIGSGAAYGESLYRLPRLFEDSPSVPTSLYSIGKYAAERTCLRLKELWGLDVVCVRLGSVIGPWERDTGVRDNFGTHSQLAAMAVTGKTALLTPQEIQRDWVYAADVANALVALVHATTPLKNVYNVSSDAKSAHPIAAWCAALKAAYPKFSYRIAADNEQPNIWYIDRDRGLMDIGRLMRDVDFRPHSMEDAYTSYIEWIQRTPEFFT